MDVDPFPPGFQESVINEVKEAFLTEFLPKAVVEALHKRKNLQTGASSTKQQALERLNGELSMDNRFPFRNLRIEDQVSNCMIPQTVIEMATQCVRKLFETDETQKDEFLGTFVYVGEVLGICSFHCVVRNQKVLDGSTLRVDGLSLRHKASYPYYDITLYEVLGRTENDYLALATDSALQKGVKFYVAGFPVLDEIASKDVNEEVLVTPGRITRIGLDLITGAYLSCKGLSGGAVLSLDGKLLGLHMENVYPEDTAHFTLSMHGYVCPEDYHIKPPSTFFKYGKKHDHDAVRFEKANTETLACYAASNVPHKSSFGSFLRVGSIRKKLSSLQAEEG